MATATVKHNYTYAYTGNGGNAYTITWYDNGTAVCSGQYSIIADSMEQLTLYHSQCSSTKREQCKTF